MYTKFCLKNPDFFKDDTSNNKKLIITFDAFKQRNYAYGSGNVYLFSSPNARGYVGFYATFCLYVKLLLIQFLV